MVSNLEKYHSVSITRQAADRITEIIADEPEEKMLRVSVEGGGCSGFQYRFELVKSAKRDDTVLVRDGATVLIDPVSMPFLKGSQIDYVDDLIGSAFKVHNPNATASCGCGVSFSV